jgi:hypothetical protein
LPQAWAAVALEAAAEGSAAVAEGLEAKGLAVWAAACREAWVAWVAWVAWAAWAAWAGAAWAGAAWAGAAWEAWAGVVVGVDAVVRLAWFDEPCNRECTHAR